MWSIDDFFIHPLFIKVEGDKRLHIVSIWYTYGISLDIPTRGQVIYFISFIDDCTWYVYVYTISKYKSEWFIVLVTCYTEVENQLIK